MVRELSQKLNELDKLDVLERAVRDNIDRRVNVSIGLILPTDKAKRASVPKLISYDSKHVS